MSRVLIIGCGGVASVAIQKCCQVSEVFTDICIASRTKSKCDELADKLKGKTKTNITTAQVDADKTEEVIALIQSYKDIYQSLHQYQIASVRWGLLSSFEKIKDKLGFGNGLYEQLEQYKKIWKYI